jgi:hypothetical protein
VLQPLEKRFARYFQRSVLRVTIDPAASTVHLLQTILDRYEPLVLSCAIEKSGNDLTLLLRFNNVSSAQLNETIAGLQAFSGVIAVERR